MRRPTVRLLLAKLLLARPLSVLALALLAMPTAAQRALPPERPDDPPSGLVTADPQLPRSPAFAASVGPYRSVQINVDGNGDNIVGDAANETSIARNPTDPDNLVVGWRQFDSITSNFRQAGWAYSFDHGGSWTFPGVLENGVFRSDPVLAAANDGTIYYQSLYDNGGGILVDVWASSDGGVTWAAPVDEFGGDKNWIAVDNSGGPGDGHVYGTWQPFFDCCNGDTFTRSINAGASFQAPVEIDTKPLFGTMAVGEDGTVFCSGVEGTFFQDLDTYVVARSSNAQDAGSTPTFTGVVVPMGGGMGISLAPNPSGLMGQSVVDTNPVNGEVYLLATVDPSGAFFSGPTELHFARSVDGGATWSAPIRVNDDGPANNNWQWFGTMDTSPDGRIDAIWNDTRNTGADNLSELFYSYSHDGGLTWAPNVAVSPVFDSHLGWPDQAKIGDYYQILSDAEGADVAYAATFNGEQDAYYLRLFPDCDGSGSSDVADIAAGSAADCNGNLIPDACDIAAGTSADVDGNDVPDECQGTFVDLGNGLPGTHGTPVLAGSGTLLGGDPITLTVSNARANAAAGLFLGATPIHAPFKGGVLVPAPDVLIDGLATDGSGDVVLAGTWPTGFPSALSFFYQVWIVDPVGPAGFAATNGLESITP